MKQAFLINDGQQLVVVSTRVVNLLVKTKDGKFLAASQDHSTLYSNDIEGVKEMLKKDLQSFNPKERFFAGMAMRIISSGKEVKKLDIKLPDPS